MRLNRKMATLVVLLVMVGGCIKASTTNWATKWQDFTVEVDGYLATDFSPAGIEPYGLAFYAEADETLKQLEKAASHKITADQMQGIREALAIVRQFDEEGFTKEEKPLIESAVEQAVEAVDELEAWKSGAR